MTVIAPSVGRVVWIRNRASSVDPSQPETAQIVYVHTERLVNVAGFDANGTAFTLVALPLRQPDDVMESDQTHAEWMPYQVGQHVKQITDAEVESEINSKGLNAPRLKPADIENAIAGEAYYVFSGKYTVCCLTLQNGYTVLGESSVVSPANFDEALGRKIARDNAKSKIWPLEGYLLRDRLASRAPPSSLVSP